MLDVSAERLRCIAFAMNMLAADRRGKKSKNFWLAPCLWLASKPFPFVELRELYLTKSYYDTSKLTHSSAELIVSISLLLWSGLVPEAEVVQKILVEDFVPFQRQSFICLNICPRRTITGGWYHSGFIAVKQATINVGHVLRLFRCLLALCFSKLSTSFVLTKYFSTISGSLSTLRSPLSSQDISFFFKNFWKSERWNRRQLRALSIFFWSALQLPGTLGQKTDDEKWSFGAYSSSSL